MSDIDAVSPETEGATDDQRWLLRDANPLRTGAMKKALVVAAVAEIGMGFALLLVPSLVGRWLLGEELSGVAIPVARVAGTALIGLCIACWPGTPLLGMLIYIAASALLLAYLGLAGGPTGILLWPAVLVHVVLTALLARSAFATGNKPSSL